MTDVIAVAKARMRELMRDGVTITLMYPKHYVRYTPARLLDDALFKTDHAAIVRMLSLGDHAEAGRLMADALERAIQETCDDEVAEWLLHQAKNQEDAA